MIEPSLSRTACLQNATQGVANKVAHPNRSLKRKCMTPIGGTKLIVSLLEHQRASVRWSVQMAIRSGTPSRISASIMSFDVARTRSSDDYSASRRGNQKSVVDPMWERIQAPKTAQVFEGDNAL
ncbi:hypothetical protein NP233_g6190 [Leucocoprinus birnbaumii]|uniref:Uncharacterized protein n=1 Tax=Leucocoprinus birnbaumii TaxID=56174 RepID=A0AAD5VX26_9AGAR|nr:hypothetical protein NP233_g6190 [Leucocoprinus birnbaumii]